MKKDKKQPTLIQAFIPIVLLICLLGLNVYFFGDDTLSGSNQIGLILAAAVAGIIAISLGFSWEEIKEGIVKSISSAMPSILILFLIGSLAGTWMISGVVPALIFYGLKILDPVIFLLAATVVSAIVSISTGSSWSTVATIGIALLGIGKAMGISEGIVAGAIISGAYFGDKMSPLSDTTNLAPAMAGTDIFTHIRYMSMTTGPSIIITCIIFLVIGFTYNFDTATTDVSTVMNAIDNNFNITPWLFLVPAFLIFIIIKKVPPLPALLAGTLMGAAFAIIFQPHIVKSIADMGDNMWIASYVGIMKSMFGEVSIMTGNENINELLSTRGMAGMLNTIWLILSAMVFGGIMETSGMLGRITQLLINRVKSTGSLVAATSGTCIFFNLTASDQYLAIVVPGRMFASTYREKGYMPELLSRTLEDSGTVTSVLIPWNTCGATQSGVLGVSVFAYAPYAFFCLLSPLMTIFFAYMNIKIRRIKKSDK